jgi:hypothetical protein
VPPKVADTEVVFVSLRSLLDVKRSHNLSYWKVVPKSAVVPMAGTKTVPIGAEEREPCVGFYSGLFGLVFFKNADYCESVYEHSYLDDDVEVREHFFRAPLACRNHLTSPHTYNYYSRPTGALCDSDYGREPVHLCES